MTYEKPTVETIPLVGPSGGPILGSTIIDADPLAGAALVGLSLLAAQIVTVDAVDAVEIDYGGAAYYRASE